MNEADEKKAQQTFALVNFLLIPIFLLWHAFVLLSLWRWFLLPLGLPTITISQAMGLGIISAYLTHQVLPEQPKSSLTFVFNLLQPAVYLIVGFLVHRLA